MTEDCLNAKLIAAAPELLSALQAIEPRLDRWRKGDIQPGPKGKDADWESLVGNIRSAIGKATGGVE